jgi:hypothetical protein
MKYWNWVYVYLILSGAGLIIRITGGNIGLEIVVSIIALLHLIAFIFWPYVVDEEHKKAMDVQAKINAEADIKHSEQYYKSLEEWLVVKSYVDSNQVYEMHADKGILNDNAIQSIVKTAGITTISVHKDNFEKACELLGIVPLNETDV